MKRMVQITAQDDQGRTCVLSCETNSPWVPMEAKDAGKVDEFQPRAFHEIIIADEGGHEQAILKTTHLRVMRMRRAG